MGSQWYYPAFRAHFPFPIFHFRGYLETMGLLSNLLFFPITGPVAGIRWSLRKVAQVVDEELTDDSSIKQELMELQMQLELGDIDDAEYVRREAELMTRLREVRAWRERLGKSVSGGPVRVSDSGGADAAGGEGSAET
jgi:Gas vesicle protein G